MTKSEYRSNRSVAQTPRLLISVDDPRLSWDQIALTKATLGADFDIVGLDGKLITEGGTTQSNPSGSTPSYSDSSRGNFTPPTNNQPSIDVGFGVLTPTDPTNVTAVWSGDSLVVTFDWDYLDPLNATVSNFIIEMDVDSQIKRTPLDMFVPNRTQTAQTLTLTKELNIKTFGIFRTKITGIRVLAIDPFYNTSSAVAVASVPSYPLNLPVPVINVAAITGGYSVSYTAPTDSSYGSIEIVEYESSSSTEPTGVTYSRTYFGNLIPANIIVNNTNARWVKARFYYSSGEDSTSFCVAQKVTPTSPVSVDNTPPNEVSAVTGTWSGDDIVINYTLPVTDAASRVQIQLTAPNNLVGYFYRFPSGSGSQTTTITKKDLFDQFGEHYSSFTGLLKSIDSADNRSSGVSFTVAARPNPLTGVTPTFTLVALSNAYSATFSLPTGAAYGEVYASHTDWTGNPSEDILVYSGLSPAIITDTDYTTAYVMMRYYDDFGNTSSYSAKQTITPLDPGLITSFENPISFGENAVIYAGNSPTSGTRTLFKTGGVFAYDATNSSPSTQIVSNASAGSPTFITKQAQIADWKISEYKIENDLSGVPDKYTGLSASGTYSFWAGSSVSGGNDSAKFTVTPLGAVTAREIYIVGTGDANSKLIDAGGAFYVKHDGSLYASSATITGNITASSGTFSGNVSIGTAGSLYAVGSGGSVNSGIRTIFNKDGVAAYNASGGYAAMLTSPLIDGSVFSTTAANIGGWLVNSSQITKTSLSGGGSITLDSTHGRISISNATVTGYTAGINGTTVNESSNAFWAGTGGSGSTSNAFRVTLDGSLYATSATITGTVNATDGYIGNADNHWTITPAGIESNGDALIKLTTGQIQVGNYAIQSLNSTELIIGDKILGQNILYTDFKKYNESTGDESSTGTKTIYRVSLGSESRQVEVGKNAEISGSYSGSAQDYRSGGLRNMYTIVSSQYNSSVFPNAGNGAVLLVYT